MAKKQFGLSDKKVKIDQANTTMLVVVAIASFIVVFSLVSIKDLLSQLAYQNRVSGAQGATLKQLTNDAANATELSNSYNNFVNENPNIIGGSNQSGTGAKQGNNSQIILDALPDTYDLPATMTSIQALLQVPGISINGITSVAGSSVSSSPVGNAVPIPFQFDVLGSLQADETVVNTLQSSIRPIQLQQVTLSGSDGSLDMTVNAQTYYQPTSSLSITEETIK